MTRRGAGRDKLRCPVRSCYGRLEASGERWAGSWCARMFSAAEMAWMIRGAKALAEQIRVKVDWLESTVPNKPPKRSR